MTFPSEIAGEQGISRQGVHDLIKRCDKILKDYEAKLHLVAKFIKVKEIAGELERSLMNAYAPGIWHSLTRLGGCPQKSPARFDVCDSLNAVQS